MTREELDIFASRLNDFASWSAKMQTDYIVYFLTTRPDSESATVSDIEECFRLLDLSPYGRLAVYLSEETKAGRYVKHTKGYRLQRAVFELIRSAYEAEPERIQVSEKLMNLIPQIKDSQEKEFLMEAVNCYRVEAFRGAMLMVWILTMDHLQKHTFSTFLKEFNGAIASHPDKKMRAIVTYDDFSELKESRVIELMRSANVISNDVRKTLDEKLGIRNSAGHPSAITISGHKTTEFMLDLIDNVLLKYK